MKEKSKPSKIQLVDAKPISIPMVSSTTSSASSTIGRQRVTSSPLVPSPASKSISRSQVAFRSGMVSRSTQTGEDVPEDLQEKRRLIRKQLAVLLHAVLCRVRDELIIGITGETPRPCTTAFCGLMKNVIDHLRTCTDRQNCAYPHCLSSRQILIHWKSCTQSDCPVCSSLRRVVPAYLQAVMSNLRWREVILTRFRWLISFIGPENLTMPPVQRGNNGATAQTEEEQERNSAKNSEE